MKTKIFLTLKVSFLLLFGSNLPAQNRTIEIPQKEFSLAFSTYKLDLSRGQSSQIEVRILKSRAYQQGKVKMGISSSIPKGVTISFEPNTGNFDFTKVMITVNDSAVPGLYQVILSGTMRYKTKGSILQITINE